MSTMQERFSKHCREYKGDVYHDDFAISFAASEVARAIAPREPSPELAEAERILRASGCSSLAVRSPHREVIAAELDRLRAIEAAASEAEQRGRRDAFKETCRAISRVMAESKLDEKLPELSRLYNWARAKRDAITPSDGGKTDGG